ncbi:helix-turn-helix domain-containing protein [Streptomyces sp.]|uniref:helix-turn-helix domain-containing protein n=1 Tax=Streptomyces sp. TaxID=1931 RepID=UPI002F9339D8
MNDQSNDPIVTTQPGSVFSEPLIINGVDFTNLMTPAEVAKAMRVNTTTVARWAKAGKLDSVSTIGNRRRYSRAQVEALLRGEQA